MNDQSEVAHVRIIKAIGVMIVVASIIQMGVASQAFQIMSYGAWWAGMFVFITGVIAVFTTSRAVAAIGLSSSIISIILCITAMSWDATGFLLNQLDTCTNPGTEAVYGEEVYESLLKDLCEDASTNRDCACIVHDNNACYSFNVQAADKDCDPLLTTVPPLLITSFYFLLLMLVMSCCYSCCMCKSVCCHNSAAVVPIHYGAHEAVAAPAFIPSHYVQPQNGQPQVDTNIYTATVITEPHAVDDMRKGNPGGTYSMTPVMAYAVAQHETTTSQSPAGQRQW